MEEGMNRRSRQAWYLITVLLGMIEGIIGSFFPVVFVERGGSLIMLSLFMALISLSGVLSFVWGKLVDTYKIPKRLSLGFIGLNAASITVMAATHTPALYGSGRVSNSLATGGYNNANAYLRSAYYASTKRGRIGNLFMGLNLAGVSIAVMFTGYVYNTFGYMAADWLHMLAVLFMIIVFIAFAIFIPEFSSKYIQDDALSYAILEEKANLKYSLKDTIKIARRTTGLISFIVGTLIFNFGVGISGPFFMVDLVQRWQFNSIQLAIIMTLNGIIQVAVMFLLIPVIDIINRKYLFTIAMLFATVPVMAMLFSPQFITSIFGSVFGY